MVAPLGLSHISLHFDGMRVSDTLDCSIEVFCQRCSDTIKQLTGFEVKIRQKVHRTMLELMAHHSSQTSVLPNVNNCLLLDGNCIPCALSHLVDLPEATMAEIRNPKSQSSTVAATRRARSYADTANSCKIELVPLLGMQIEKPGLYLLHSEDQGAPHCVAVRCTEDTCTIMNGKTQWIVKTSELMVCAETAIDRPTIVTYIVSTTPIRCSVEKHGPSDVRLLLMDLQAGAGRSRDVMRLEVDSVNQVDCVEEGDDEGQNPFSSDVIEDDAVINVGDQLLSLLEAEVNRTLETLSKRTRASSQTRFDCNFCPFRSFREKGRLVTHLRLHHTRREQYCCSGTKQVKVITALWDNDSCVLGKVGTDYLARIVG